jgi:hypothetical protein
MPEPYEFKENALTPVAKRSICGGAVGAVWGGVLATVRGHPVGFYSSSMGFNFFVAGGLVFAAEEGARHLRGRDDVWNPAIAGLCTGSLVGLLFAGPAKIPVGAAVFAAGGVGAYGVRHAFASWRQRARERMLRELEAEGKAIHETALQDRPKGQRVPTQAAAADARPLAKGADAGGVEERVSEGHDGAGGWWPEWLPIQRIDEDAYRAQLQERMAEIDAELDGRSTIVEGRAGFPAGSRRAS